MTVPQTPLARRRIALSLFWRTFCLLALLLAGGIFAWTQTFRALESEPRAVQAAQQIASLVHLARVALTSVDGINRIALIKGMSEPDSVTLMPRERTDRWMRFDVDSFTKAISQRLQSILGPGTLVASSVNDRPGLWVGVSIDGDPYWVLADRSGLATLTSRTWFAWIGIALLATALASAAIARAIDRPLRELSSAASRIRDGDFGWRLDEQALTSEVREVNQAFNHMARELAQLDEDRAVMLAGISHDLRTPLARLRLEAEMSIADDEARRFVASDIDQLDAIIGKFTDYARPSEVRLAKVELGQLVLQEAAAFRNPAQIRIDNQVANETRVLGDEIELARVLQNLFENARRYARDELTGRADVVVTAVRQGAWVVLEVRDFGSGVDPAKLDRLTTPFFRGDTARTAAGGAGLGLAIVEKAVKRMGGEFSLSNASGGGLSATTRLKSAA